MSSSDVADYWEQRLADGPTLDKVGYRALGIHFNEWMYRVRRAQFLGRVAEALAVSISNAGVNWAPGGSAGEISQ